MKYAFFLFFICCLFLLSYTGCKRPYEPPEVKANNNYLVVDGVIINSVDSPTIITLSRTRNLVDTILDSPERNAAVTIEGSNGESFQLSELSAGYYSINHLALNTASKYRLKITTASGGRYLSDFVEVKQTPPIDSVNYKQPDDLTVFVNSHDPTNSTRYYRWEYFETYEYHSENMTDIGVSNGLMYFRNATNQIYKCWTNSRSTDILIGSTTALTEDVVSQFPLITIPQQSRKIGVRYSILVKQYALTQEAYQYWQILKKNTEQLGSIFDVQPAQLVGNIHSDKPDEPVVGFVSACNFEQKRLFVRNQDLTGWPSLVLNGFCDVVQTGVDPSNYLIYTYPNPDYVPWYFTGMGTILVVTKKPCVDCREQGGTNNKPAFW